MLPLEKALPPFRTKQIMRVHHTLCISVLTDMQMPSREVNLMDLTVYLFLSVFFFYRVALSPVPSHHQDVLMNDVGASPASTSVTRGLRYYKNNI